MSFFGYDSLEDMFDGGGKGGSGDTFSTKSNAEYKKEGGKDTKGTTFVDRVGNTASKAIDTITSGGGSSYKIKSGDTLSKIAAANGTTVEELAKLNGISDPNKIVAGADLKLPSSGATVSSTSSGGNGGGSGSGDAGAADGTAEDETTEEAGSAISKEAILQMVSDSGLVQSNEDIMALVADPKKFLEERGATLSDLVPNIDPATAGTLLDPTNPNYLLSDLGDYNVATVTGVAGVNVPAEATAQTYEVATSSDRMNSPQYQVDPVTGEIRDQNLVNAENYTLDMQGSATGINADGTRNVTGEALNDYASQGMSQVIDTRTVSGKILAQNLGEGNYIDAKATMTGQLDILSQSFVDANGNPTIPTWAQAQARAVSRTITLKGMTGTAATAAMATALMEASLPIAQQEAEFFQTLTVKNLDNKQQAIINKATVLSKFDLANLDAREAAAVQNAQAFLEMDLTNLSNEQQAEVINTQAMVQALFEDTQQENVQRRFTAETANEFTKFYDELGVQVEQFNAELFSQIKRFNAGEINDATEFSQTLENQRQQFYANMQYAVDLSNAKWRQSVTLENTQMQFDAAATDTKNYLDLSQEGLNRLWDRVDAQMDYLFKGALSEEEFELRLLLGQMNAQANSSSGPSLFQTIMGAVTTLGSAYITAGSDARMKENIQPYDVHNGIQFYTWDWNDKAKEIGWDKYPTMGVIAQEVQKTHPEAVIEGPHGYLMVNYGKLTNEV